MNLYIITIVAHCLLAGLILTGQDQETPSLRSIALNKAAELLYQKLAVPQSVAERKNIINTWDAKLGVLLINSDDSPQTHETIMDRFEQKYARTLHQIAQFDDAQEMLAIIHNGTTCCYKNKDRSYWTMADIKIGKKLKEFKHEDWIMQMAFTCDGTKALSAAEDNTFKLWDLETGECVHNLEGHSDMITHIAITRDKTKALSSSLDNTIKIWDLKTGSCLGTLQGHSDTIIQITSTSNDTKALSVSHDQTLMLWDINSGICLRSFRGHERAVNFAALTSDNTKALSASDDQTLKLWDLETGTCIHTLTGHTGDVIYAVISPNNKKALSSSRDRTIKLWDLNTGECLDTLLGHTDTVNQVTFTSDNTKAVSVSHDDTLKLWDITAGECLQTIHDNIKYGLATHNNIIGAGKSIYRFANWQEIINSMPKPANLDKHN